MKLLLLFALTLFPCLMAGADPVAEWTNPLGPWDPKTGYADTQYKSSTGRSVVIYDNLPAINLFLSENIKTKEESNLYIHKFLPNLALDYLTVKYGYTEIMDADEYKEEALSPALKMIISKYDKGITIVQKNGLTIVQFNIRTQFGEVQSWKITCKTAPLSITSFQQELMEPEGTLPSIMILN